MPAPRAVLQGVPSPLKEPEKTNMVIFRENSETSTRALNSRRVRQGQSSSSFAERTGRHQIRFPNTSGIGVKPVSREGTERLIRKAIQYAIDHNKPSVTIVHKGNIMKYTEGGFRDWAYALAQRSLAPS